MFESNLGNLQGKGQGTDGEIREGKERMGRVSLRRYHHLARWQDHREACSFEIMLGGRERLCRNDVFSFGQESSGLHSPYNSLQYPA